MGNSYAPSINTSSGKISNSKLSNLSNRYPLILNGRFDNYTDNTVKFVPEQLGNGIARSRFTFPFNRESYGLEITDSWTLSTTGTGINLNTFTAGRVDGLAKVNGDDQLIWAFLDSNHQWAGIGLAHKPKSAFTSVSSGNKGSTGTFGVTNANQFTVGARVRARNSVGTAPYFEYNWGTIASIVSNIQITVTLDNHVDYGTNITGVTSGVVEQFDLFRPWVPTGSGQTLFQPYYTLVGEIQNDESSGDIIRGYRSDEEFRMIRLGQLNFGGTAPTAVNLSRFIPLWAAGSSMELLIVGTTGTGNLFLSIGNYERLGTYWNYPTSFNVGEKGMLNLAPNAHIPNTSPAGTASSWRVIVTGFYISGGMRE